MKASIDERGTLTITAENSLESYALDRWSDDYFKPESSNALRKSVLLINCAAPAHPGEQKEGDK